MKTPERPFNKEPDKVYIGLTKGNLEKGIRERLREIGIIVPEAGRRCTFPAENDQSIIFRARSSKEIPEAVARGVVDLSIVGEDRIFDTGQGERVVNYGSLNFSNKSDKPSRLVLAGRTGRFADVDELRGRRIATEYVNLTRQRLMEIFGFSESDTSGLVYSDGSTEGKIESGEADAITDISETGKSLGENGLAEIVEIFQSYPQIIANREALGLPNIGARIEAIALKLRATQITRTRQLAQRQMPTRQATNCII